MPSPANPNPVLVALGWLLVVLGGVWTLLTGGCSLFFVVSGAMSAVGGRPSASELNLLPLYLALGAAGVVPGALILWGGLTVLKDQRRPTTTPERPDDR